MVRLLYLFFCIAFVHNNFLSAKERLVNDDRSYLSVAGGYSFLRFAHEGSSCIHGNLGTVEISYLYRPVNRFYGGVVINGSYGPAQHSGVHHSIAFVDGQERVGYTVGNSDRKWAISFFSGVGYRWLLWKENWCHFLISHRYDDIYIPVGISVYGQIHSWISVGLQGQWKPQVISSLKTLSKPGFRWVTEDTLTNFLLEMPILITGFKKYHFSLVIKPFYEYWEQGRTLAHTKMGISIQSIRLSSVGSLVGFEFCF